jgi:hypothetical protein
VALRLIPFRVPLNVSVHVPWVTFLLAIKLMVDLTGAAPKLIEEGVIEQVVLAGLPEHPSATVPVRWNGHRHAAFQVSKTIFEA